MGVVAAVASVVVGAYAANEQHQAQKEARNAQNRSSEEQRKARMEQQAIQAQQQAAERRAQFREERVKRARILQASANSGALGSSGELGAEGNLATQAGSAIGANIGLGMHGANITAYNQNAANFMTEAQNHMVSANEWGQIGSLGMSVGMHASSIFGPSAPTTDPTPVKPTAGGQGFAWDG